MKKAYIFDLDGVLIDSKHMMEQSWNICELEHKLTQPFEEYFKHIGMPFRDILKVIGIEDNHDAIKHTYDKASIELMEYCLEFYPGVEDTLRELKKHAKLGVVTSKTAERTRLILDKLDIEFDNWFYETSLFDKANKYKPEDLITELKKSGDIYDDGTDAILLKAEEPRVLVKSDGTYTYFATDLACLLYTSPSPRD